MAERTTTKRTDGVAPRSVARPCEVKRARRALAGLTCSGCSAGARELGRSVLRLSDLESLELGVVAGVLRDATGADTDMEVVRERGTDPDSVTHAKGERVSDAVQGARAHKHSPSERRRCVHRLAPRRERARGRQRGRDRAHSVVRVRVIAEAEEEGRQAAHAALVETDGVSLLDTETLARTGSEARSRAASATLTVARRPRTHGRPRASSQSRASSARTPTCAATPPPAPAAIEPPTRRPGGLLSWPD